MNYLQFREIITLIFSIKILFEQERKNKYTYEIIKTHTFVIDKCCLTKQIIKFKVS